MRHDHLVTTVLWIFGVWLALAVIVTLLLTRLFRRTARSRVPDSQPMTTRVYPPSRFGHVRI
jgi:uncharacterized membrane protein YdfJ with MMPL/SSD domain